MTDIFTATYGTRIRSRGFPHPIEVDDSTFGWQPLKHYVGGSMMDNAMAEWYQHRRDVELGRWRDPENPNMVVYPLGRPHPEYRRRVRVVNEMTGEHNTWSDNDAVECPTAKRYFAAHPEPKPWHDAQPGEVWLLTINDEQAPAIAVLDKNTGQTLFATPTLTDLEPGRPLITAGQLIYPPQGDQ